MSPRAAGGPCWGRLGSHPASPGLVRHPRGTTDLTCTVSAPPRPAPPLLRVHPDPPSFFRLTA